MVLRKVVFGIWFFRLNVIDIVFKNVNVSIYIYISDEMFIILIVSIMKFIFLGIIL